MNARDLINFGIGANPGSLFWSFMQFDQKSSGSTGSHASSSGVGGSKSGTESGSVQSSAGSVK